MAWTSINTKSRNIHHKEIDTRRLETPMKEREIAGNFCIMVRLHENAALFCAPTLFLHPCLVASLKGTNRIFGSQKISCEPQLRQ
jgi:hypothetical protein